MKKTLAVTLFVVFAAFAGAEKSYAGPAKTAAELEKEKALADPYANDLGPATIDVSGYPKNIQEGYKLLTVRCAQCHTPSRPLNSQFVEADGKTPEEREANAKKMLAGDPEMAKNKYVWQVEGGIWQRYVKRMMSKPGCNISKDEGKKIWEFVSYDSRARKTGANKAKWMAHRKKLLEDFKAKHPERYKTLYP
jgi:mono/diheme cytochrome c family protein